MSFVPGPVSQDAVFKLVYASPALPCRGMDTRPTSSAHDSSKLNHVSEYSPARFGLGRIDWAPRGPPKPSNVAKAMQSCVARWSRHPRQTSLFLGWELHTKNCHLFPANATLKKHILALLAKPRGRKICILTEEQRRKIDRYLQYSYMALKLLCLVFMDS